MAVSKGRRSRSDSAFTAYLSLIADSQWATQRVFKLWLSSRPWRTELLQRLQDEGMITCINLNDKMREKKRRDRQKKKETGEKNIRDIEEEVPPRIYGLRYSLTKKGQDFLRERNPIKYGDDDGAFSGARDYNIRRVYRLSLLSEMRAMSELAGFTVHDHAKPHYSVLSSLPVSSADRPAFSAFTASEIPSRYKDYENTHHNQNFFQYFEESAKRKSYGYDYYDAKQYSYRETPVGCIYTLPELQTLAESETELRGNNKEEQDRLRYARLSGALFTGHGTYRLYNTERTAPRLRVNGERNMKINLDVWSNHIYKRSLRKMKDVGNGKIEFEEIIADTRGAILFGDSSHDAAVSVIKHTIKGMFGKIDEKERALQNYNLNIIPNTYFIPVIREAIPLYSMMLYEHWPVFGTQMGKEYLEILNNAERSEAPILVRDYAGETFPHGQLSDGSYLAVTTPLHLDSVKEMILSLPNDDSIKYTVMAMEWQKPFFKTLLEEINPDDAHKLKFIYMPQSHLEKYAAWLHEYQKNTYYAQPQ